MTPPVIDNSNIDQFWLKEDGRLYAVMHTLLYPGVLGSLMYAAPDKMSSGRNPYPSEVLWLAGAFALAFVFDYIHSAGDRFKQSYTYKLFMLDLVIVIMLFGAGQRILGNSVFMWLSVPAMLAIAKFSAALWEIAAETKIDSARNTDVLFAVIYSGIAIVMMVSGTQCWPTPRDQPGACTSAATWVLAAALVADALSFLYYKRLARRLPW